MSYRPWAGLPDYEIKAIPKDRFRRLDNLIKQYCSAYYKGNCIFLDDGNERACAQMKSGRVICRYFRWVILPLDMELEEEIYGETGRKKICVRCGKPYYSESNRSRYCSECSGIVRKNKKNQWIKSKRKKTWM